MWSPRRLLALALVAALPLGAACWPRHRRGSVLRVTPAPPPDITILGRVVGVLDGDTIDLLDMQQVQVRVRLMGIDAPEKAQPYGQVSKRHLSDLVFGKVVEIHTHSKDRYGRVIGKILVAGVDANLEQVRAGLAWHYKQYEREQVFSDAQAYAQAEQEARAARRGLWQDPAPMAPWDYRHRGRTLDE